MQQPHTWLSQTLNELFHLCLTAEEKVGSNELRASSQQALSWPCRRDLPLNAGKSYQLLMGGPPDLRLPISEEDGG